MLGFKSVFLPQNPPASLLSFLLVPTPQTLPISQTSVFGKHFPEALAQLPSSAGLPSGFVRGLVAGAKLIML